jgi:hypothetical protein
MNLEKESMVEEIAKTVLKLKGASLEQREKILERADEIMPEKAPEVKKLVLDLCYERGFCKSAGLNYSNIQEEDSRLIRTAVAEYLMRDS